MKQVAHSFVSHWAQELRSRSCLALHPAPVTWVAREMATGKCGSMNPATQFRMRHRGAKLLTPPGTTLGKGERKGLRREEQGMPPPPEPAGNPTKLLHSPGVGLLSQPSGVPNISESVPTSCGPIEDRVPPARSPLCTPGAGKSLV